MKCGSVLRESSFLAVGTKTPVGLEFVLTFHGSGGDASNRQLRFLPALSVAGNGFVSQWCLISTTVVKPQESGRNTALESDSA